MPSRSDDSVAAALEAATALIVRDVRSLRIPAPVVLIDGQSGAGKSSLAALLVRAWPLAGRVQLIALDSLYPGWDGLDDGVRRAHDGILSPHRRGEAGSWREWDWERGTEARGHSVDPGVGVIVEGSGILTPATAGSADLGIWLESAEGRRRERALARDGEDYRPHWDRWAAQEVQHVERDSPRDLASRVIDIP